MLAEINAISILDPKKLQSVTSSEAALSTLADLSDPRFVNIAKNPSKYGLPSRLLGTYGIEPATKPTWQIFPGKIPSPLLQNQRFLENKTWTSHVLVPGTEHRYWTLSYEAGSAVTVNFYLEAANELNLTPVTTSELHHSLVLRKLKRVFVNREDGVEIIDDDDRKRYRTVFGQNELIQLLGDIFPISQMSEVSFAEIVKFRKETQAQRQQFIESVNSVLRIIDDDPKSVSYDKEVISAINKIKADFQKIENDLSEIRDKVIPAFAKAFMYGTAGGGTLGALASFLGGFSPSGIVGASALTITGAFLSEAVQLWNERRKIIRTQSSGVTYLARISKLVR